ncbi:hypothetical protein RRF57_004912 [Xylaria bambusicola]|uniref:Uncharacterized protein n=1 Tax=Xylaria bambusicola TaxID=326684 RepID=A0AAN7Z4R3_9PEZI
MQRLDTMPPRRRDHRNSDLDDSDSINHNANQRPSGIRPRASTKRSLGEASKGFEDNKNAMIEALKMAPGPIQRYIASVAHTAVKIAEHGHKVIGETQPPQTWNEILEMLPKTTIDDVWTEKDEERLQAAYIINPYRQFLKTAAAFPLSGNHNYWTMWKMIPRLRNCFPSDIIGVKNHLKYAVEVDIGNGVMKPDPRWSGGFCDRLTQLALGSPCDANMGLLALLIRYAVADRLDDRRKVPLQGHQTDTRFFEYFGLRIQRENDTKSLRDMHAELRQDWKEGGIYLPWASDVMCSIEQLNNPVRSAQPTVPIPGETYPEYPVDTPDLTRLVKACDMTGNLGYAHLDTVEQRAAFISHGRTKQDPLQSGNQDQLNALRIPLLEEEERFKARRILLLNPGRDEVELVAHDSNSDKQMASGDFQQSAQEEIYTQQDDYDEFPAGFWDSWDLDSSPEPSESREGSLELGS